jgi:ATP-dependent Clp protease adapter protein ClpS
MTEKPQQVGESETDVVTQEPAKVILFNDDVHTFDEVIGQLIKALRCTQAKAEGLAAEAHQNGKALVFSGELIRCMEVSAVLEEIQLMTQIEM